MHQKKSEHALSHRYLVAVSGGVDSVVLLDILSNARSGELIVAHVDHGIRPDSADDARFVEALADRYGLPYVSTKLELRADASEDTARRERYKFLRTQAQKNHAHLVTAHHGDDVVETVAINFLRGTGWRGLAVLGAEDIYRPMTSWLKRDIVNYAITHKLEWCEDSTNAQDVYLRNRVRRRLSELSESRKREIITLWQAQCVLRDDISEEVGRLTSTRRYPYIMIGDAEADEVLRATLGISLTRPQLTRALIAIKTLRSGATHRINREYSLVFSESDFVLVSEKK